MDSGKGTASDSGTVLPDAYASPDATEQPDAGTPDTSRADSTVVCLEPCIVYVDSSAATGGDGLTPQGALHDINLGINAASGLAPEPCTCEVRVAAGVYRVWIDHPEDSIQLARRVQLNGGYASGFSGDSDPILNETTLDGRSPASMEDAGVATEDAGIEFAGVFHVVTGAQNSGIDGFTITGGYAIDDGDPQNPNNYGGGLYSVAASPDVTRCVFIDNSAVWGGAMYNGANASQVSDCTFFDNQATEAGGGLANRGSQATFTDCTFEGNSAPTGGAVFNGASSRTQFSETAAGLGLITLNSAEYGAGMHNEAGASPTLTDISFVSNTASHSGGGMYNDASTPNMTGTLFRANRAADGAAIYNASATVELSNCRLADNVATGSGAGIYNAAATVELSSCRLADNIATGNGGGILNAAGSSVTVTSGTLEHNSASNGGGVYVAAGTSLAASATTFHTNLSTSTDTGAGGGAILNRGTITIEECVFSGNNAIMNGGAIQNAVATATISGATFDNNSANDPINYMGGRGGAIYDGQSHVTATNCTFTNNHADIRGGAIYEKFSRQAADTESLVAEGCIFSGNSADRGGAMTFESCAPTIRNSIFNGNNSVSGGGALSINGLADPTFLNSMFVGNTSAEGGVAEIKVGICNPVFINCTMFANDVTGTGGGFWYYIAHPARHQDASLTVTNSILWGNTANGQGGQSWHQIAAESGAEVKYITYSVVEGGCTTPDCTEDATGNLPGDLADDPGLVAVGTDGAYQPSPGATCINAGNDSANSTPIDLLGNPRKNDTVDMGAVEIQ